MRVRFNSSSHICFNARFPNMYFHTFHMTQVSGALGSGVGSECKAWPSARFSGLAGFPSFLWSPPLSSPPSPPSPPVPPQSSGINPGKWEGPLPPRCYPFPGVQIPGQPRIRRLHGPSVRKKNNKWWRIQSTGERRWEKGEKWKKMKKRDEVKGSDGEQAERQASCF